jgi:hypothetical protein
MKKATMLAAAALVTCAAVAQQPTKEYPTPPRMSPEMTEFWTPQPPIVTPAPENDITAPPSDAIVLLGKGVNEFVSSRTGEPSPWIFEDGVLTCVPRGGMISSKSSFGDCQLHVEWRAPLEAKGTSQGRGNSGVYLQGLYEVQVLDNYDNETYSNGAAGSIYKQSAPLVNPARKPGEWNTNDIIFTAPLFREEDGKLLRPGSMTVIFNGVLVQNHYILRGTTEYIGHPRHVVHGPGPLQLQDHSNPVSFRNIWIREL